MNSYEIKHRLFEDEARAARFYQCVHYIFKTAREIGLTPPQMIAFILRELYQPDHTIFLERS